MGEVYRARDGRLNRGVAIKVLLELSANDPEHVTRFKREAQLLASLSHPHIAAIYGFEEVGGVHALVLELVEGPTLADRIVHGPIPIEDALPLALQIAEALEAAHEVGIVHRDLKPANVKVSDQDVVKVLDFGLAKALDAKVSHVDLSQSPTLTGGATRMGVILGTAAYMAPEQARGKAVDRRADVWAFGCVLYEMLTGRRTFEGEVISETLASVLRGEPDWGALPPSTPRAIERLLRRCLQKDPRERLQAIGDARIEIKEAIAGRDDVSITSAPPAKLRIGVMAAVAAIAATLAGGGVWLLKPAPTTTALVTRSLLGIQPFDRRSQPRPGETRVPITRRDRTSIALTPDGRTLVMRALGDITEQLWVRSLDKLETTPLAGTEGADSPFISPDGAWVGYRDGAELKKIPIAGGVASSIARIPGEGVAPRIYGASWGPGDVIVFATNDGLWQVGAGGGEPRRLTTIADKEYRHTLPHVLPDGRAVLYTITTAPFRWDDARIVVRSLDGGEPKALIENGADPRYVASGHIVFVRSTTMMAVPFDLDRLEVTGSPVALVEGVMQTVRAGNTATDSGAAQIAVSSTGRLVYATGGPEPETPSALVWVDRNGKIEPLSLMEQQYRSAANRPRWASHCGVGDRNWADLDARPAARRADHGHRGERGGDLEHLVTGRTAHRLHRLRIRPVAAVGRRRWRSRCSAFLARLPHTKLVVERWPADRAGRPDADDAGRHLDSGTRRSEAAAAAIRSDTRQRVLPGVFSRRQVAGLLVQRVRSHPGLCAAVSWSRAARPGFDRRRQRPGLDQQRSGDRLHRPGRSTDQQRDGRRGEGERDRNLGRHATQTLRGTLQLYRSGARLRRHARRPPLPDGPAARRAAAAAGGASAGRELVRRAEAREQVAVVIQNPESCVESS